MENSVQYSGDSLESPLVTPPLESIQRLSVVQMSFHAEGEEKKDTID